MLVSVFSFFAISVFDKDVPYIWQMTSRSSEMGFHEELYRPLPLLL